MKTKKPAVARRSVLPRVFGYGGSFVLVVAAVMVLLMPLLDEDQGAGQVRTGNQAAGGTQPTTQPDQAQQPGGSGTAGPGTGLGPQQNSAGGQPNPGNAGQGDPVPGPGGGSTANDPCPAGLGTAQHVNGALRVTVQIAGTAYVQAEVRLRGLDRLAENAKVSGGKPHTFVFKQAPANRVERVTIKTVGTMAPQTCDLRL